VVQIVSVNENDLSIIKAYPNPTEGEITIENASGLTLQVFNPQGQLIKTEVMESALESIVLNVSPGLYFINLGDHSEHILVK
ncbi:MAG: T9SS type A sorting domain-containing protein, partial [Bacteroidota bacterium]